MKIIGKATAGTATIRLSFFPAPSERATTRKQIPATP